MEGKAGKTNMASMTAEMSTRRRFAEVMRGGRPDRVPLFSEGMRADVLRQHTENAVSVFRYPLSAKEY